MLHVERRKMRSVSPHIVEFVVVSNYRCEIQISILKKDLITQLVDSLHVLLI